MNPYLKEDLHNTVVIFRKNILVLLITIISYLGSYALNVYLARLLTAQYYGNIALVMQFLTFFVPLGLFGTELSMVRYISKYLAQEDLGRASGFLRWSVKIFTITSFSILVLGILGLLGFELLVKLGISKGHAHILLYSFWLIPIYASIFYQSTFLQVLKHYYLSAIYQGIGLYILIILSIYFLAPFFLKVIPNRFAELNILLCFAVAYLIMNLIHFISLWIFLPSELFDQSPIYEKKQWLSTSVRMMGSTLIFAGLMAIDIFMVELIAKNEGAVGFFASISVIASSIAVFGSAIDMILNPRISIYVENHKKEHLQGMLNVMNTFKIIPAIVFVIVVILFGHTLLSYFGKDFTGAYSSLIVLAISFFIGLCFSASGPLLTFSKHQSLGFKISFFQLVYIVIMDFIFIPIYGVLGAVIVLGSSIFFSSLIRIYFVRKYLGVKSFFFF